MSASGRKYSFQDYVKAKERVRELQSGTINAVGPIHGTAAPTVGGIVASAAPVKVVHSAAPTIVDGVVAGLATSDDFHSEQQGGRPRSASRSRSAVVADPAKKAVRRPGSAGSQLRPSTVRQETVPSARPETKSASISQQSDVIVDSSQILFENDALAKQITQHLQHLEEIVRDTAAKAGLKHSLDSSIKRTITDIKQLHNQERRQLRTQVAALQASEAGARAELKALRDQHAAAVADMRREEAERIRKLKLQHRKTIHQEVKIEEERCRSELQRLYEVDLQARVEEAVKAMETELREKVSSERSEQLEAKIQLLEKEALAIVKRKAAELKKYQNLTQKLEDDCNKEHLARVTAEQQRDIALAEISSAKAISRDRESTLHRTVEDLHKQLQTAQENVTAFKIRNDELQSLLKHYDESKAAELTAAQRNFSRELDSLQIRVQQVVAKKDDNILRLKERVTELSNALEQAKTFAIQQANELRALQP